MWLAEVPLVELFQSLHRAAYQCGYRILITLIAREADCPHLYAEIGQHWTSLHDLTGQNILFAFAGPKATPLLKTHILQSHSAPEGYTSKSITIAKPGGRQLRTPDRLTNARRGLRFGTPILHEVQQNEIAINHTLEIGSLMEFLDLHEDEVPCLLFTFLSHEGVELTRVPLEELMGMPIYQFLKFYIMQHKLPLAELKSIQKEIDTLEQENQEYRGRVRYLKEQIRSQRAPEIRFAENVDYLRNYLARYSNRKTQLAKALKKLLDVTAGTNFLGEHRAESYRLIVEMKSGLVAPNQHGVIRRSQRLIDLRQMVMRLREKRNEDDEQRLAKEIEDCESRASRNALRINKLRNKEAMLVQSFHQSCSDFSVRAICHQQEQAVGGCSMSRMDNTSPISILFLTADPSDTARLRLGEEAREIQEKLQLAKMRDRFVLHQRTSVRPADLSQALLDIQPQVVHFSGHGTENGALCFEDKLGNSHLIQPDALASLFKQFANQVSCVLLNSCYSKVQANSIAKHINYVIGMNQAIGDKAAVAFSVGFYQALGAGLSIEKAYELGCVQIRLESIPEHMTPVFIKKN